VAARPGAFNVNFAPDTLDAFRSLCKDQGKQYTKVLERFAELYIATNGEILNSTLSVPSPVAPQNSSKVNSGADDASTLLQVLLRRVEKLEKGEVEVVDDVEDLNQRLLRIEGQQSSVK
jgi:hypothetical protein